MTITGGARSQTQDGGGGNGGGLYNGPDSTLSISDCTISGNSAADFGGGVAARGLTMLDGCTISGNSAFDGGGVYGAAHLTSCTITGNTAGNDGGGFDNSGGSQGYLADSTISGNSAANGGGVYGFASLVGSTISGDKAGTKGGGLCNDGPGSTYLGQCTINGNSAMDGGGLYTKSETTLTECTISGNSAVDGGGLENGGAATIQGCTIGGNYAADEYGGLMNFNGSAQLTDTIVAGNILPPAGFFGDNIADIGGSDASTVTGSNNLIGTGGSGGIKGGTAGNIVLTSLTGLGLAPLANYGGPTQTIALLPGSPALGTGTAISGLFSDQRGEPIGSSVDIGAFQSQGFTLEPAANTTPQSTLVDDGFADPLEVTVKANNPVEPVAGGMVTYTLVAGAGGASGTLSAATATIGSGGTAQVTATAGSSVGTFTVNATPAGADAPAQFKLSNLDDLSFSGLQDPLITYGTPSVTLSGTLSHGSKFPPPGETVAIALDGVTQQATIGSGGTFATTFATASLAPSGSPYTVSYTYAGDATYIDVSTISTLSVTKATPTVSVSASPASATYGQAVTLVATVTGSGTPTGTVTFLDGTTTLGTETLDNSGNATLTLPDPAPGALTVTASYGGDADFYAGTASTTASVSIAQATPTVSLSVSPASTAYSQPLTLVATVTGDGNGTPTGTVAFSVNGTVIDSDAPLNSSGQAMINVTGLAEGTDVITATYNGDADFAGGVSATASASVGLEIPTVSLSASATSIAYGQPLTLVATVTGNGTPSGTVTFTDEAGNVVGIVYLNATSINKAPLTLPALTPGTHSFTATYNGDAHFESGMSAVVSVSVVQASAQVVVSSHANVQRQKVRSVALEAVIAPAFSGGVAPTGTVTFVFKNKTLGTAMLVDGAATLMLKPSMLIGKEITVLYDGDADYMSSMVVPPVLTRRLLKGLEKPMVAALERSGLRHMITSAHRRR